MTFAEKLVRLRKDNGFTQEDIADWMGVSTNTIHKWEHAQRKPDIDQMLKLSELFNVSVDQLLKEDKSINGARPSVIKCPQCGRINKSNSKFCGYCGQAFNTIQVSKPKNYISKQTAEPKHSAALQDDDISHAKVQMEMKRVELEMKRAELAMKREEMEIRRQSLRESMLQTEGMRGHLQSLARCPNCGSTSISVNKKGYSFMKGAVGAALFGPWGLLAGGLGANKIMLTCMKCGHQFKSED